jgi:hypothetical protein
LFGGVFSTGSTSPDGKKQKNDVPIRKRLQRFVRSIFSKKLPEDTVVGGPGLFGSVFGTGSTSPEGKKQKNDVPIRKRLQRFVRSIFSKKLPEHLAGCIGKNNKLNVMSVDALKSKISSAATVYQTMVAKQAQTLSDAAAAATVIECSAQDCMIGAYIAHQHPETKDIFIKLFESVRALRRKVHHYHKNMTQYEFFFKSDDPRVMRYYPGTILDWLKLLSGSSAGLEGAKRSELLYFSQKLLSNRHRMPSYLLPSPKLIQEGKERYSSLRESAKSKYRGLCRSYDPNMSDEDFDRRLAVMVLIMNEEEQPLVDDVGSVPGEASVLPTASETVSVESESEDANQLEAHVGTSTTDASALPAVNDAKKGNQQLAAKKPSPIEATKPTSNQQANWLTNLLKKEQITSSPVERAVAEKRETQASSKTPSETSPSTAVSVRSCQSIVALDNNTRTGDKVTDPLIVSERFKFPPFEGGRTYGKTLAKFTSSRTATQDAAEPIPAEVIITGWTPEETKEMSDWFIVFARRIDLAAATLERVHAADDYFDDDLVTKGLLKCTDWCCNAEVFALENPELQDSYDKLDASLSNLIEVVGRTNPSCLEELDRWADGPTDDNEDIVRCPH